MVCDFCKHKSSKKMEQEIPSTILNVLGMGLIYRDHGKKNRIMHKIHLRDATHDSLHSQMYE